MHDEVEAAGHQDKAVGLLLVLAQTVEGAGKEPGLKCLREGLVVPGGDFLSIQTGIAAVKEDVDSDTADAIDAHILGHLEHQARRPEEETQLPQVGTLVPDKGVDNGRPGKCPVDVEEGSRKCRQGRKSLGKMEDQPLERCCCSLRQALNHSSSASRSLFILICSNTSDLVKTRCQVFKSMRRNIMPSTRSNNPSC